MSVNEITASRQEFALALTAAGLDVVNFVPERIIPPVVVISSGATYITPETLGHEYVLNLELTCIAAQAVNEQSTEALDALLEAVIKALPIYAAFEAVNKPFILSANQGEYLAATVNVSLSITI
jgi:hypothetical protein